MGDLKTSQAGIDLICRFEGFRSQKYFCAAGKPTIGYGHVILSSEHHLNAAKLTVTQAKAIMAKDLGKFENAVLKAIKVPVLQHQFDAMVSLAFNVGAGAFAGSTLVSKLNKKDYQGAADEFLRWNKAGGKVLDGLTKRRVAERQLFLGEG